MTAESLQRRKAAFQAWMTANDLNVNKVAKTSGIPVTTLYSYTEARTKATKALGAEREERIARAYDLPVEAIFGPYGMPGDVPREPNNIRAWREERELTIDEVAKRLGITPTSLEILEEGWTTLSGTWMRRLAEVFGLSQPGFVALNPKALDADFMDVIGVPKADQAHAREVLDTFKRRAAG